VKIAPLLLALTLPAQAAVVGVAEGQGAHIALHDDSGGLCVGSALMAEHVPDKGDRIMGCWTVGNGIVFVVFLDGEIAKFPIQAVKPPKTT
jgi:hypothetical protein